MEKRPCDLPPTCNVGFKKMWAQLGFWQVTEGTMYSEFEKKAFSQMYGKHVEKEE